ncbi:MAG: response regulator [Candidatus Omnitrophica bacterium]|nr:response regulator [Candidatus Omnitrophota bacterium]
MISEKIAVIDDDPRVIKSLKMALTEYEIIDFTDSKKAVVFFQKLRDINLILLDVMMPGIDGISALEEIKKTNKDTAVIIMTAYSSQDIAVQALVNHADDFIEKPFNMDILKDKIRGFLRQRFYFNKNVADREYKVERIKSFIQRNYNEVTLDIIAEEMCLSSKYVSRMFKEQTGMSYRDFYIEAKMEAAKQMLKNTAFNVDEISYQLGYQNPESFMRIFKSKMRLTPSQYREKYS